MEKFCERCGSPIEERGKKFKLLGSLYCEECIKIARQERHKTLAATHASWEKIHKKEVEKDKRKKEIESLRKKESLLSNKTIFKIEFEIPCKTDNPKQKNPDLNYVRYAIGRNNVSELWLVNSEIMPDSDSDFNFLFDKIRIKIYHNPLNKNRIIKGHFYDVEEKATAVLNEWNDLWIKREAKRKLDDEISQKMESALKKTDDAELKLEKIKNILRDSLFSHQQKPISSFNNIKSIKDLLKKSNSTLRASAFPFEFKREIDLDFNKDNSILIISYLLPSLTDIPSIKKIAYSKTKNDFIEIHLSDRERKEIYDHCLYQIVLKSINDLYALDSSKFLKSIIFNGWVDTVDKGTGKDLRLCILSLQVNREEFIQINLAKVDPKMCFKSLKGVGSSKLYGMAPIAPILDINRTDKRFIQSTEVICDLDESLNIAAMDWQDFEQLIREIFEKEFSDNGGEVKVTQSSRDGGVDAIAFDPDPLRGGKIVIQAKRYTNVVGISAVRDLYGTVINEGATRGILVTTSDYGAESYKFAKGKPLTLLNGSNLLHILERHGYKAKIDLVEAKKILADRI